MTFRPRQIQVFWLIISAALLAGAACMLGPLDTLSQEHELVAPGNVVLKNHPEFAIYQVAPGGLRAPLINYLWMRADQKKSLGQYWEAMQLSEMIGRLQPRFADVWAFRAFEMSWNISVQTHTPEERWMWVTNGIRLLRDEGIPFNPRTLSLYKELGWIFFSKMAGNMDDMHMVYKRRWAAEMHHLLGAPPLGETPEVVEAFRPIAQAPLDRSANRQGQETVQADRLAWMIDPNAKLKDPAAAAFYDPQVAQYASLLAQQGIAVDWPLLAAYNHFSADEAMEVTRVEPVVLATEQDKKISELINSPKYAAPRGKLLAFVRAQLLWNTYKMDPQWMLGLMEKFGPIDWRLVVTHGLYWVSYGLHVSRNVPLTHVDSLNTDRIVLNCLKELTWYGRLLYRENPREPAMPVINMWSDWRFIEPALKEFDHWIELVTKAEQGQFDQNTFKAGHMNYLVAVIEMLYAMDRPADAQKYFDRVKAMYPSCKGEEWDLDLEQFVAARIEKDGPPIPEWAVQQYTAAIMSSFAHLGVGDTKGSQKFFRYAQKVYTIWQRDAVQRLKAPPFEVVVAAIVRELLIKPSIYGRPLDLVARSTIYTRLDQDMQKMLFDGITPFLRRQCQQAGMDFVKAFPEPTGMKQWREEMRRQFQTRRQN